jgi:hypothetical protein
MADAAPTVSVSRELLRILRRHPRQLPERLMLFAVARLGEPTRTWARELRARTDETAIAERCGRIAHETTIASRLDGAVAGTPFFIALVPAYVTFLWSQARMVLRIAALQGRDTTDPAIVAELLVLRGIHPTVEDATRALATLDEPAPKLHGFRERAVAWVQLVRRILVLAAFASPSAPDEERPPRRRQLVFGALGLLIWLSTYVFPVTFMVVMAWGCEHSTRELSALALDYYGVSGGGEPEPAGATAAEKDSRLARARTSLPGARPRRRLAWTIAVGVSITVPIALIALSVSRLVHHGAWATLLAPLAGLALVIALAVRLGR